MTAPNSITSTQLMRLIGTPDCPVLIDICLDEDFGQDPRLIPTSVRHGFGDMAALAPDLQGKKVVIICQKGLKLSQGAAAVLRCHDVMAEFLEGGVIGWRDAGGPLVPHEVLPDRAGFWVTRHRPKIDRIACPWLIRRFIDPKAQFLYVAPSEVLSVADRFGAIPFDVPGAGLSHQGTQCSFDAMLTRFAISSPALTRVASIVRAADGNALESEPQAAGLLAISLGLSRMYKDDLAQLEAGLPIYDALYRWARDAVNENHSWDAHGGVS